MSPKSPNLDAIQAEASQVSPAASRQSRKEKELFDQDKLRNAHTREQRAKNMIHFGILIILSLVGLCLMVAIVIRVIHLFASEKYMWLTAAQLDTLDNMFKFAASGTIGALLTKYLNKNVED